MHKKFSLELWKVGKSKQLFLSSQTQEKKVFLIQWILKVYSKRRRGVIDMQIDRTALRAMQSESTIISTQKEKSIQLMVFLESELKKKTKKQ